jgi:hypothetical protein
LELETGCRLGPAGSLSVAAITRVYTLARVAEMLGEDADWLFDISDEMDPEDGRIWVIGPGDEQDIAFTEFGIENLAQIVEIYKSSPILMDRYPRPE